MRLFLEDLRHAVRYLAQHPVASLIVSCSLALAIGCAATVFSYIDFLLWKKLPVGEPEQLVRVAPESGRGVSHPEFEFLSAQSESLESMAAWAMTSSTLDIGSETLYSYGQLVSGNYFATLAVDPQIGRLLLPEDDRPGAEATVVVSDRLWRRHFGADPSIVGKSVILNHHSFTVVGVAPKGFLGAGVPAALYLPLAKSVLLRSPDVEWLADPNTRWLSLVGRMRLGATVEQVQANLESLARPEEPTLKEESSHRFFVESAATAVDPATREFLLPTARQLMIFSALLIFLTCANVSNLLIGRTVGRLRDMGVRLALGASRSQLIQRLLLESVVMAVLGGMLGALLAFWGVERIESLLRATTAGVGSWAEGWPDLQVDLSVLFFALLVALVSGLAAGLLPALWASSRSVPGALLKNAPSLPRVWKPRHFGVREILVVAQVAVSVWLLAGTALLVQSLSQLHLQQPGFETESILLVGVASPNLAAGSSAQPAAYSAVARRVESLPGVTAASLSWTVPLSGWSRKTPIQTLATEVEPIPVNLAIVGERYFETLKIPMAQGREFREEDDENRGGVAILNEALARKLWPGDNPLSQRISLPAVAGPGPDRAFTVVGLVGDTRQATMWEEPEPLLYLSLRQNFRRRASLLVRSSGDPAALTPLVREELRDQFPDLAIIDLMTFSDHIRNALQTQHLNTWVVLILGIVGLLLATFGVGAAMSSAVRQRTHEIGIRMALGADRGDARRLVVRKGMGLVLVSVGLGLTAALLSLRLLAGLVEGAKVTAQPLPLIAAGLTSLAVAFLACQLPAHRATRIDPLVAMKA